MEKYNTQDLITRKVSLDTFKDKMIKLKKTYKTIVQELKDEEKDKLSKAKSTRQKKTIKRKYKLLIRDVSNRFSLTYTSYKNEQLYRKGALEARIALLRSAYKKKKNLTVNFDKEKEKEQLNKKISKLKTKYSKPVSTTFRKKRSRKVEDINFVYVPVKTPVKRAVGSVLLVILAALLTTLALDVFVKPFGIYSAGLRGITQAFFYLWNYYDPNIGTVMSYLLFFAVNVPLAIFGYFFIGKRFTFYTLLMMAFQPVFSYIFTSDIFGNLESHIKPFGKSPTEIFAILRSGQNNTLYKYVLPLISGIVGAVIYGLAVGLVYRAGGSTGGSKFVVTWVAAKTNRSIGRISLYFSIFVVLFGIILNKIIIEQNHFVSGITSSTLVATIMFAVTSNVFLDKVFAKSRREMISVITDKRNEIMRFLDVKLMYNRTFSVTTIKTNFHKKQKYKMEFLVSKTEAIYLMNILSQLDTRALISSTEVRHARGPIYSNWFE